MPSEVSPQAPMNVPYVYYLGVMKTAASPAENGFWEPANLFPQWQFKQPKHHVC